MQETVGVAVSYNETGRRARKAHVCDACNEPIRPGDVYTFVSIVFDGSASNVKRCARCQKIHLHLRERCAGDERWPRERLNCGLDYKEEWGAEPPPEIAALAFALPGEVKP